MFTEVRERSRVTSRFQVKRVLTELDQSKRIKQNLSVVTEWNHDDVTRKISSDSLYFMYSLAPLTLIDLH